MLDFKSGSKFFEDNGKALVNAVSCDGTMDKGLSKLFAEKFPRIAEKHEQYCREGKIRKGVIWQYIAPNKLIINIPIREKSADPVNKEYIRAAIDKLIENRHDRNWRSIAFPAVGVGDGTLSKKEALSILVEKLSMVDDVQFRVYSSVESEKEYK